MKTMRVLREFGPEDVEPHRYFIRCLMAGCIFEREPLGWRTLAEAEYSATAHVRACQHRVAIEEVSE